MADKPDLKSRATGALSEMRSNRKPGANASNFERIRARSASETIANRDVFESQQLERSQIERPKSGTPMQVIAAIGGILVAVAVWFMYSLFQMMASQFENRNGGTSKTMGDTLWSFGFFKLLLTLGAGAAVWGVASAVAKRQLAVQNAMNDTADINQHDNDQQVMLPEEMMQLFDFVPDVGGHSSVSVSSMIAHAFITNDGVKKVDVAQRATEDTFDEDGSLLYYKGEILLDDDGEPITKSEPFIDLEFAEALYDASGVPKNSKKSNVRKYFNPKKIPYNPGGENRDKLGDKKNDPHGYDTVADLINKDWDFPIYETQRPGGVYIVDTAPVNTMVLAITRAGKGQTVIEPTIDMWTREKNPNNMIVNDPKGELLVKNYVRGTMRGFQIIQFNLINPMKTDIYNPLGMAADAAREGDSFKCAQYVEDIAEVFFPVEGGEDPVWATSANNAFKRSAYGLIDYFMERERQIRLKAAESNMDPKVLDTRLDALWGQVTLYNCYQLFVQMSARKLKNPLLALDEKVEKEGLDPQSLEYEDLKAEAQKKEFLWNGAEEASQLDLYFAASAALPINGLRTLVGNTHNSLQAMSGSDKMLASVYGIAITAMSFFTDPTISTLTSGRPSQNTDLGGLSFPRRMGVRMDPNYMSRDSLMGKQAVWTAYEDDMFTKPLGKDFDHEDTISREGWARYYFKGKFESDVAYVKLEIKNPQTHMLIRTFYFYFKKDYQVSLDGRYFVTDPITEEKIVKNGIIDELLPVLNEAGEVVKYERGHTKFKRMQLTNITSNQPGKEMGESNAFISTMVRYSEKPKMVFLVTPPHLMKYAKLILILIRQLVNLNFDRSYMTKANQKPLYKTRFMLDELGKSEMRHPAYL